MTKSIYNAMNQGGGQNLVQSFSQFMSAMRGKDPSAILQQLVSSGRVNQAQLNRAQQMAQGIAGQLNQIKGNFGF